jgi:LmbE family N-acetylglucosaminyl deacetylase
MLHASFAGRAGAPLSILCVGAHADDIEIGCGGALLALLERHPGSHVRWMVFAATPVRADEARNSAQSFLERAGSQDVVVHDFRDGFFPAQFAELKTLFELTKRHGDPDLIFTHTRSDHHQDHRLLAELTWNTFRNHLILEYEVLKYDPDLGNPNLFVPLRVDQAEKKVQTLMAYFPSQAQRHWFDPETFFGQMRIRGVQCAAPSGFAEAFYVPKLCL